MTPHDVKHLFIWPAHPTTMTPSDLWSRLVDTVRESTISRRETQIEKNLDFMVNNNNHITNIPDSIITNDVNTHSTLWYSHTYVNTHSTLWYSHTDVNTHSTLWYSHTDDHRGQLISYKLSNSEHIIIDTDTLQQRNHVAHENCLHRRPSRSKVFTYTVQLLQS